MPSVEERRIRYTSRLRDHLLDNFPHLTREDVKPMQERYRNLDRTVFDIWCSISTHDNPVYTEADLQMFNGHHIGTTMSHLVGYCVRHETLHHYDQHLLREKVEILRLEALNEVKQLGVTALSWQLWDHLVNPYHSQVIRLVDEHAESLGWARQLYGERRHQKIKDIFYDLTYEEKEFFYICGRKSKYVTREDAAAVLNTLPATTPGLAIMRVYQCDTCKQYHLGHANKLRDLNRVAPRDMDRLAKTKWMQKNGNARHYAEQLGYYKNTGVTHAAILAAFPKAAIYDRGHTRSYEANTLTNT